MSLKINVVSHCRKELIGKMTDIKKIEGFRSFVEQEAIGTERDIFNILQMKRYMFEEKIIECIEKAIEKGNTTDMVYLHFAFLRAHIVDGTYIWYVQFQDKDGDLDLKDKYICMNMSEFFLPLEELQKKLLLESKKYIGKISGADIQLIKLSEFDKYINYIYLLGIIAFKSDVVRRTLDRLSNESPIQVTIGEYMGTRQTVCVYRKDETLPYDIRERLYADIEEDDWKNCQLQFGSWKSNEYIDEAIVCKNVMGSSFINSRFNKMELSLCNLMFVNFNGVELEDTHFWNCEMYSTVFKKSVINNVSFSNCRFNQAEWVTSKMTSPGIMESSFGDSKLLDVEFLDCDMRNCDFSKASLMNVTFTNCNLNGVVISSSNLKSITVPSEQIKIWLLYSELVYL